jgi:hypothetical protein
MNEAAPPGDRRARVLCLLKDAPSASTLRWIDALTRQHDVDIVDLAKPGLSYAELVDRIFASERVISW